MTPPAFGQGRRQASIPPSRPRPQKSGEKRKGSASASPVQPSAAAPRGSLVSFGEPQDFSAERPPRRQVIYADAVGMPMLFHTVPVTLPGITAFCRSLRSERSPEGLPLEISPHFRAEFNQYRALYQRLSCLDPGERPAALVNYLREAFPLPDHSAKPTDEVYESLKGYVRLAGEVVSEFIRNFVPEELQPTFTSDGLVDTIDDPVELFFRCATAPVVGEGPLIRMRSFELRRKGVIAQELLALDLGPAGEARMRAVEREFTARLEERFFSPGKDTQVTVRVAVSEKTGNAVRVLSEEEAAPQGCLLRLFRFHVRYFEFRGRYYPVFFNPDQKRLAAVLLKMFARSERDALGMRDICRFEMVFRRRFDLEIGIKRILEDVFPVAGATHSFISNLRDLRSVDALNPASSLDYRVVKVDHYLHGNKIEGQYRLLEDYVNAVTSLGEANHRRYKERRLGWLRSLFLPKEIYGVDWESSEIRAILAPQ